MQNVQRRSSAKVIWEISACSGLVTSHPYSFFAGGIGGFLIVDGTAGGLIGLPALMSLGVISTCAAGLTGGP